MSDVDKYIAVSKAHTEAIKAVSPQTRVSVPVHWRNAQTDPWNMALKDQDYYDAVTLHKHMGNDENREGAAKTLDARREMVETGKTLRNVFPNRPIWVSEWSVSCGDNVISILAMADTYLGLLKHPELFEIADYFQINASHPLIVYDKKTNTHTRTSYGAAYEIIRDVFKDGEIVESTIDSSIIGGGIDAVSAEVVVKDGRITVLAINKTPRAIPVKLAINGVDKINTFVHKSLSFGDLNHLKTFEMTEPVLTDVESNPSGLVLPPLSISRIDLVELDSRQH